MLTRREMMASAAALAVPETQILAADFDQRLRAQQFSGAVLAMRRGQIVHRAGYGFANKEHDVANAPETRFLIASISKTMTSGAMLKLAGEGRVDLDAPISRYLATPSTWSAIKVAQLLDHSDGLPDVVRQPDFGERMLHRTTLRDTVAWLGSLPLDFAPGTNVAYGNSGHVVAAALVERVNGQPFNEYLAAQIYAPLGMADTGFGDNECVIARLAGGYRHVEAQLRHADYIDMTVTIGAGSEYSTVDDLAKWIGCLERGMLAAPDLTRRMFTPGAGIYGMSWAIERFESRLLVSHIGDINGFGSYLGRFPDDDATVVVLSNLEGTAVRDVAFDISRRMLAT